MATPIGPERARGIAVLHEQITAARQRLDQIGAIADDDEFSFERRDAADLEYGALKREVAAMEAALALLTREVE